MTNSSPTDLILCPATTGPSQATNYVLLFPHDGRYSILLSMWCSSRRWAIQDAAQDLCTFLTDMFPDGYKIHFKQFKGRQEMLELMATMNLEQAYDLPRLSRCRSKYGMPPWRPEDDKYRYVNYEID